MDPRVAGQLRVERRREQRPLPNRDDPTRRRAPRAPRPPSPTCSTHGARMKTACIGLRRPRATSRSASNESTCRPNALRRTVTSSPPSLLVGRRPAPGRPAGSSPRTSRTPAGRRPARSRSGSSSSKVASSLPIVVDSPPGSTMPVELGELRRAAHRHTARHRRTPGRGEVLADVALQREDPDPGRGRKLVSGSPAALGEPVVLRELLDVDADHGLAETARHLGDHVRVVVERGGLDDRRGARGRVAGLEDAASRRRRPRRRAASSSPRRPGWRCRRR